MAEERNKKIIILRGAVVTLFLAILVVWMLNLGNVWRAQRESSPADNGEWSVLKDELTVTLSDLKSRLDQNNRDLKSAEEKRGQELVADLLEATKNKTAPTAEEAATSTPSLTASSTPSLTATSTPTAASSTTKALTPNLKRQNCPEWINCMPTIGQARPCTIPPGCEDFTQIAY